MSGYDPVLFDLDGTVIDTVELIRESHRHATRAVLGVDLPDERLVAGVGRPLMDQMRMFSLERAEELFAAYREWNLAHTRELVRPFPGMEELLAELAAEGRRLAVVTSKSGPVADLAFDVLPLRHHFAAVISSEDTADHKPHPAPVLRALAALGADGEGACMVGDSPYDLRAGVAAGIDTIGVTWGFFDRADLEPVGPGRIVDSVEDLGEALRGR